MPNLFRHLFKHLPPPKQRSTSFSSTKTYCSIDGKKVEISEEEAKELNKSMEDVSKEMDNAFKGFDSVFGKMDNTFDKINKMKGAR